MIDSGGYAARIINATPAQLIVVTYDLVCDFLSEALESGSDDSFAEYTSRAKDAVTQLMCGLNFKYGISQELYDIYLYVYATLTRAFFRYERAAAKEAAELLGTLREGFINAANSSPDTVPDEYEPEPQVYAGLTYQRDGLAEFVDQSDARGFKA